MSADYKVQRLYDEYIKDIVSDSDKWKKFLELTGRLYRYEFDNILMMYAQRPNATLVGDYDSWKKVGRYVKRGSKGIAIFPSKVLKTHMRYVFDISDTAGRNVNLTWNLNDYNLKFMVDELIDEGKIQPYISNEKNNLQKLLKNYTKLNVRSIIREKSEVMISELNQITGGVIKDRDNKTQGPTVEEMLYKSVFYAVGTRCGFNMSSEEQDMNFIINISGEDNIYRFGSLVCDVSCSVLKEFNYRVRHIENERRVTNGRNETDVPQESRWNVVSQPKTAGNSERRFDAGGKIRDDGSRISEREREKQVQHTLSFREIRRKDEGSGRGSQQFIGNINEELSKNTQAEGAIFNNGNVEDKGAGKNDGGRSSSEADSVQISLESVSGTEENISIDEEIERELEEIDSLGIGEEAGFEQASFFFDENTKEIGISDEKRVKNFEFSLNRELKSNL